MHLQGAQLTRDRGDCLFHENVASAAAPAEVICKDCTYTFTDPAAGAYLGAYWPGDRGSFNWRTQFVTAANSFWVIDLNANGTLVFTACAPAAAPFIALAPSFTMILPRPCAMSPPADSAE